MSNADAIQAKGAPELTYDSSTGTGSFLAFSGPLVDNPVQIIFDNQSTVSVVISDDGTTSWKTFIAGEMLVLDMPTNRTAVAVTFTWPKGTQFYGSSSAGTGYFRISYTYAR